MNLDRLTPKSIKQCPHPVETMLENLETFADAIGGPAWRQGRARGTSLERTVALYMDEDYEVSDPEVQQPLGECDEEEITVAFTARREVSEADETSDSAFCNLYKLSYSLCLPLASLDDMPAEYRDELKIEMDLDADAETKSDTATIGKTEETRTITETNTIEYTIRQDDGSIEYSQYIDYNCGDIHIEGANYSSEPEEATAIHAPQKDNLAEEWLPQNSEITTERLDAPEVRIMLFQDMERLVTDHKHRMEIVAQSDEAHAVRVLSLLSLISNGIRTYDHIDK